MTPTWSIARRSARTSLVAYVVAGLVAAACSEAVSERASEPVPAMSSPTAPAEEPRPAEPAQIDEARLAAPATAKREPLEIRVARSALIVHTAPTRRSPRRGRIDPRQPFAIYGVEPGPGCEGESWAAVDLGGWVCLERTSVTDQAPRVLPALLPGKDVPFIYARPKILDKKSGAIATVPRYRDRYALTRGDPPIDHLAADRQYTFVETRLRNRGLMLIDADDRTVPARDMKIARESAFSGRDLAVAPIPEGLRAAWSVSRPATLRERADPKARALGVVAYHATLNLDPRPIAVGEDTWYAVPNGGGPGVAAYVVAADVNQWIPGPALAEVGAEELWIDVELGQQALAVMRGQNPVFVTLVSTGAGGTATPQGLFRVYEKLALSTMKSGPNAEDPYFVEGVPWIQYFHRRFAFHTAYWHDDFGKRRSHGCVNLAPKDAAYLYGLTTPVVPPGWNSLVEHVGHPGTLVRVRRGDEPVPDKRLPLGVIEEDEPGAPSVEPLP